MLYFDLCYIKGTFLYNNFKGTLNAEFLLGENTPKRPKTSNEGSVFPTTSLCCLTETESRDLMANAVVLYVLKLGQITVGQDRIRGHFPH
jgi:hypothetical protein